MASYTYTPLSPGTDQFRLLTLLPANEQDERIAVYLHPTATEAAKGQYEALSYVWGSPDNPETISVISNSRTGSEEDGVSSSEYNAAPHLVTQNLAVALRHLRRRVTARTLWIDAICIDQQNIAEKSEQVLNMAQIYKSSARVVIWLGPGSPQCDRGMQIVDRLGQALRYDQATEAFTLTPDGAGEPYLADLTKKIPDQESFLRALAMLFRSPWFERLWVVQEALASSEVVVVCGTKETIWQHLLLACFFLRRKLRHTSAKAGGWIAWIIGRLRHIEDVFKPRFRPRLLELVQVTQWHKCADDRDRVYAVLSLAVDGRGIKPDYSLSTVQVYQELVMFLMKQCSFGHLKFLKFCEISNRRLGGPSWVPDWAGRTMPEYKTATTGNSSIDCGVASFASQQVIHPAEGCIQVTAARVGTIVAVDVVSFPDELDSVSFPDTALSAACREITRLVPADIESSTYKTGCSLVEAYSGALLGVTYKPYVPELSGTPPFLKPQDGVDALRSCLPWWDTSPGRPVDRKFLNYVYRNTRHKALVKTEQGYIGTAPSYVEEGDIILAILSCTTFTIIRPVPGSEGRYQVVGNSFLYGLNSSEAVLGPLPAHIHAESHYHSAFARRIATYRNTKTNQLSWIDPRYEALGIHFEIDGYGVPKVIRPDALEKAGIGLSQFDLV